MCDTCGCSDGSSVHITDPDEISATRGHQHEHSHGHAHSHEHDHDHRHAHDEHDREHAGDARAAATINDHNARNVIRFEQQVLAKNDLLAERNRGWFEGRGILALNLMSSPGAGKTTLLERTLTDLGKEVRLSVIEGDQETVRDAERIRRAGARAIQINTGSGCHLDAQMVSAALHKLAPPARSLVIIENVGNLVCPGAVRSGGSGKGSNNVGDRGRG